MGKRCKNKKVSPNKQPVTKQSECNIEPQNINEKVSKSNTFISGLKILVDLATVVTAIVAVITLHEMQADRDAAYQPHILINPTEYNISWNEEGQANWLLEHTRADQIDTERISEEDGIIGVTYKFPLNIILDGLEQFSAVNVGVGVAHNISFSWSSDNIEKLNDYLIKCDPSKDEFMLANKSAVFSYDDRLVLTDLPKDTALMYMLQDAGETYMLSLPQVYYMLLHEIIQTNSYDSEIPYLWLEIRYYDVQGNLYINPVMIQPKITYYYADTSGAGNATFQLIPIHPASAIKGGA